MRGCLISTGCKAAVPGGKRKREKKKKKILLPPQQDSPKAKGDGAEWSRARHSLSTARVPLPLPGRASGSRRAAPRASGGQGGGALPGDLPCLHLALTPAPPAIPAPGLAPCSEAPVSAQPRRSGEDVDKAEPSPERLQKKMRVSAGKVC